jgi:hypothetical protein
MLFRKDCDWMNKYYPRIADKLLEEALESAGAVRGRHEDEPIGLREDSNSPVCVITQLIRIPATG